MKTFIRTVSVILILVLVLAPCLCGCEDVNVLELFARQNPGQPRYFLNIETLSLLRDDTYTLTVAPQDPQTAPRYNVEWISDNENIVLVDNGVLYAKALGTANVRARLTVQSETPFTKDLICTVTVHGKNVPLTGLTMMTAALTMTEGDSQTLTVALTPSDTSDTDLVWASDSDAVSVSQDGTIIANKKGSATVTAMSRTNPGISTSCLVTVKSGGSSQVQKLTLDASSVTISVGASRKLKATVSSSSFTGTVTWSSDNDEIAAVSEDGYVTGIAKGTTYITATAGAKTATCRVTVSTGGSSTIRAKSVEMDKETVRVIDGPSTIKLNAVIYPFNSTESGSWSVTDSSVATVSNTGVVTVKALGKKAYAETTVRYAINADVVASCKIVVIARSSLATAISTTMTSLELKPGQEVDIPTTVTPTTAADLWVWTSSDESVVKVDEKGHAIAVDAGTAVITVASADKPSTKLYIPVKVEILDINIALTVSSEAAEITTFDPVTLHMTVDEPTRLPEDAVFRITVSNDNGALVSEAEFTDPDTPIVIRPVKKGRSVVSVEVVTEDTAHNFICNSLNFYFDLPRPTYLDSPAALDMEPGESSDLPAKILPEELNPFFEIVAESSNTDVAEIIGGRIVAKSEGTAVITMSLRAYPTMTAKVTVTVKAPASSDPIIEPSSDPVIEPSSDPVTDPISDPVSDPEPSSDPEPIPSEGSEDPVPSHGSEIPSQGAEE